MTAAPGPQQPDEGRAAACARMVDCAADFATWSDEHQGTEQWTVPDAYIDGWNAGRKYAAESPAAPSAQPALLAREAAASTALDGDTFEVGTPTPTPSLSQQRRRAEQDGEPARRVARYDAATGEVDYGDWSLTPAQPVRDTGAGRR